MTDTQIANGALYEALSKAQAEFSPILKTKTAKAGSFTYNYADIADVLHTVLPVLSKHGIAVIQMTETDEANVMFVRTRLAHKSGQSVESVYPVASINADHQKMGGALTYARRYALTAMIGVAAEDDLDGANAGTVDKQRKSKALSRDGYAELQTEVDACSTLDELAVLWRSSAFQTEFKKLPLDWQQTLTDHKEELKASLADSRASVAPNFDRLETAQ